MGGNLCAEASKKSKSDFLANMSHEIRTILNGITGMGNLLMLTKLDSDQEAYVRILRDSTNTLIHLMDNILDLSKIEAGKMQLECIAFDFMDAVEEAIQMYRIVAEEKGIEFITEEMDLIEQNLIGDPVRLKQLLTNILSNAVKFTRKGRIEVYVKLIGEDENSVQVKCGVKDSGIGISPGRLGKLFDSFTQADSTITRKYGGTGLGLAISKSLVEVMGGSIGCESVEGTGSHFYFTLAFKKQNGKAYENANPALEEKTETDLLKGRIILVVEDDRTCMTLMEELFEKRDVTLLYAEDGEKAIGKYKGMEPDIILMDLQMPGIDAFTAAKAIRQMEEGTNRHTPIIAITAFAFEDHKKKCFDVGMDDYITKPVDLNQLFVKIISLLYSW